MKKYYTFTAILVAVCIAAIAYQIIASRGPAADSKTVGDISAIQNQIEDYASTYHRLPVAVSSLSRLNPDIVKRAQKYSYSTISASRYKLCAEFLTDASKDKPSYFSSYSRQEPTYHQKGYQCFENQVYSLNYEDYSTSGSTILKSPTTTR